ICKQQGEAVFFPTIDIGASDCGDAYLAKLDQYDVIIFVSQHAVYQSQKKIQKTWPIFPPRCHVVAVGKSTADALAYTKKAPIIYPLGQWNSEALLHLPLLLDVHGKKIAIIRGETGRELIENTLLKRGAEVDNI